MRRELLAMGVLIAAGCAGSPRGDNPDTADGAVDAAAVAVAVPAVPPASAVHVQDAPPLPLDRPLVEAELVAAVLARNPSLVAMRSAWLAARSRTELAQALPEPTVSYALAPLSLRESDPGQELRFTQPIPWTQRLRRRGDEMRDAAAAVGDDVATLRLHLIAEAKQAMASYWQAAGALSSNQSERTLIQSSVGEQTAAYAAGSGTRSEVLRLEMALNEIDHHAILLEHDRSIAVARLNLLLHRDCEAPLPPPPAELPEPPALPDPALLTALALQRRPDLAAAEARRRAAEAHAAAIGLQDLPDLSVSAGYSTMWSDPAVRLTVGVDIALPLNRAQRAAERAEASAGVERARAEQAALMDRVRFEVREGYEHVFASWHILHLTRERMVPIAEQISDAAAASVAGGGRDFAALLAARRELIQTRWSEQLARADLHERYAELERLAGGDLGSDQPPRGSTP